MASRSSPSCTWALASNVIRRSSRPVSIGRSGETVRRAAARSGQPGAKIRPGQDLGTAICRRQRRQRPDGPVAVAEEVPASALQHCERGPDRRRASGPPVEGPKPGDPAQSLRAPTLGDHHPDQQTLERPERGRRRHAGRRFQGLFESPSGSVQGVSFPEDRAHGQVAVQSGQHRPGLAPFGLLQGRVRQAVSLLELAAPARQ